MKYTAEGMELFNYKGTLFDVCQNRHKGNPESVEAFQSIKDRLTERQKEVLRVIRETPAGLTTDEIAQVLFTTPNAVSGRVVRAFERRQNQTGRSPENEVRLYGQR